MDALTLERLISEYGQDVWNFAFSIVKDKSMADDIAQETFLQVYRNVASFRGESSIKTWLLKIARNIAYNYRRSAYYRKVLLFDYFPIAGKHKSAEETFLEREVANNVWAHVLRLPAKLRETLVLHAKYQLSLHEISHVLNVPEGTVKSRLHTARKKMDKSLKEELRR